MEVDIDLRVTPEYIEELQKNEIFVFGSNLPGLHVVGAANIAHNKWGAKWGKGTGLHGQTYAIPTMQGTIDTIKQYVDEFINFAKKNTHLTFLVTPICDIAGLRPIDIAPLFYEATSIENIFLPNCFWRYLA